MVEQTFWVIIAEIAYILLLIAVCFRIIWDTRSVSKTLAYLLLVIFVPLFGMIFYFSFGINYRKRKIYTNKLHYDEKLTEQFKKIVENTLNDTSYKDNEVIRQNITLINLFTNPKSGNYYPLFKNDITDILTNGEVFFPLFKEKLLQARHHIHIEFYIYEDDVIGNEIKDILIRKAREGVEVRFIYDDFGSKNIRKKFARELNANGVRTYPFNKIKLIGLANRLNYRNHRKIVVIDGETSFVGGINICDKYINNSKNDLYWRDTHLMLTGYASYMLQHIFLLDWYFCSDEEPIIDKKFFPLIDMQNKSDSTFAQIISSGPDSDYPHILNSIIQAIHLAKKEVQLTTPYYIPDEHLQQTLILAALSGIKITLLVPKKGDSAIVNMVAQAYFEELLNAGIRIFLYTKGFIHAKTFVVDGSIASVGTANLDLRSFDLNFEVSAIIYDKKKAQELSEIFLKDLENAEEITLDQWQKRSTFKKLTERILRLFSPFM